MDEAAIPRIIVALDFDDVTVAEGLVASLPVGRCRLKVGKELFLRAGPEVVRRWSVAGWDVFLDLKFHDIPNTVAGACRAAADLGAWMVNVHTLGGPTMMEAARAAVDAEGHATLLTGVTVLTSHSDADLERIGIAGPVDAAVSRLGGLAVEAGLDGVVCAAGEAAAMRDLGGTGFRRVTPGIRPTGVAAGDQSRVMTPAAALAAGATDLVIGRPITRAADPLAALASAEAELSGAGDAPDL